MKRTILALAAVLLASSAASAAGNFTGFPAATFPGTASVGAPASTGGPLGPAAVPAAGCIPMDTGNLNGVNPATVCVSPSQLAAYGQGGVRMYFQSAQVAVGIPLSAYGTDTTPVAGTTYLAEFVAGIGATVSSISCLNGSVGATDLLNYQIYSATGARLATTALAGVVAAGANAFQAPIPLTAPLLVNPGLYFVGVQFNGTTTRFRTISSVVHTNWVEFAVAGAFGNPPGAVTVPQTNTPNVGPICVLQ